MEYLERTEIPGNYTSPTIGEIKMEATQVKAQDVVATMTFPSEQFIQMFKDFAMTKEQVEEMIEDHDLTDCVETLVGEMDLSDKVTDVLSDIDMEDYISIDTITENVTENLNYRDIAREVTDYIDKPDATELANELLSSFDYQNQCYTGQLFVKSVETIIEGFMKKQTESIVQPTVIENDVVKLRSFTIQEINEVLDALQYTEYNKSRILTSLSLK